MKHERKNTIGQAVEEIRKHLLEFFDYTTMSDSQLEDAIFQTIDEKYNNQYLTVTERQIP